MFRIHQEGQKIILISCAVILILGYIFSKVVFPWRLLLIATLIILLLLIVYFFRYPKRTLVPDSPKHVYAPADGKVVVIEDVFESTYLKKQCKQVSIFMSPLNVHVNWSPIGGNVIKQEHIPGKYLVAWHPKSSTENERTNVLIDTGSVKLLVSQVAGAMARRIINYLEPGDKVKQGQEMGFIRFGSRVDVFLPLDAEVLVEIGQKVIGKQTKLAMLP
ncbi:MAG: phosphatidylserine decarboxylase family protein [Saprospiraceae bacterium]|nr:phosphatidylserine decarboxylase family protein [Saprospiraceae bacterium]